MGKKQFVFILSMGIISGLLSGALSVWFLMPPSVLAQDEPQKVIEAQEFKVVDEDGETRAILSNERLMLFGLRGVTVLQSDSLRIGNVDSGSAVEIFADEDGARLTISTETNGALTQVDPEGIATISDSGFIRLTHDESNGPSLDLSNKTDGTSVFVNPEGITTFNDTGLITLAHDESGSPFLQMHNKTNGATVRVNPGGISTKSESGSTLLTHNLDGPSLMLQGSSGEFVLLDDEKIRATLSLDEDGNPSLQLTDSKGDVRAVLGSTRLKNTQTGSTEIRAVSSLVLFDEEGNVVWSAP